MLRSVLAFLIIMTVYLHSFAMISSNDQSKVAVQTIDMKSFLIKTIRLLLSFSIYLNY